MLGMHIQMLPQHSIKVNSYHNSSGQLELKSFVFSGSQHPHAVHVFVFVSCTSHPLHVSILSEDWTLGANRSLPVTRSRITSITLYGEVSDINYPRMGMK